MSERINIKKQKRKSLALVSTADGLVALIPEQLDAESERVRRFVANGLKQIPREPQRVLRDALSRDEMLQIVACWSSRLGVRVGRVQIRAMTRKWASCSSRGTLTVSTAAVSLPRDLIDYVVCHELIHLKIPGHGRGFRVLVRSHISDWEKRHRALTLHMR
jgi:hypothetical protein